jgi:hypothetical protein
MKTEKEYRADPSISQSSLGYLSTHPKFFRHKMFTKKEEEEVKDYFVVGGALDTLLTNKEEYHNIYIEEPDYKLTKMMKIFCEEFVRQKYVNKCDDDLAYELAHIQSGYKISLDKIKRVFNDTECQTYVKFLLEKDTKLVLKREDAILVRRMYKLLTESEHCGWLFKEAPEGINILFQVAIFFEVDLVPCKGLLDIVVIDHNNKTIQIIDLKTTAKSVYQFKHSFITFYYYIQAAFYTRAMESWKKECKEYGDISEYRILNFKFLVQEKSCYNLPVFYPVTDNDLKVGKLGGYLKSSNEFVKGYVQLLDEYKWHKTTDYWEMPKDLLQNNFHIELNVFKQ